MKLQSLGLGIAALAIATLSGCASIVDGSTQSLSVRSIASNGHDVDDAHCTLTNNKGTWYTTTPGTVSVHRSYDPLHVDCRKSPLEPGLATVASATKGMAFGNIIAGGIIGAAVDMSTGAAYDYPPLITVNMGEMVAIGAPAPPASTASIPTNTAAR